jgi:pSer/pThr/pTyr-binding forkhead associated (FHA) protein
MKARLAIYKGMRVDLAFPLVESITAIGRDSDNLIQLPDPKVSKRHAVVHAHGGVWSIEDMHSTNGVTVNGVRVQKADLKDGDRIHIGPFELVFEASVGGDWVPSHVIDMSTKVSERTLVQGPEGAARGEPVTRQR